MEYALENIFLRVMKLIKIMSTNSLTHLRDKQFCFTCNRNLYDFCQGPQNLDSFSVNTVVFLDVGKLVNKA